MLLAVDGGRLHAQRRDVDRLGMREPRLEPVGAPFVHQEADGAEIEPEDGALRLPPIEHRVESLEHEPVTAQRDDEIGLVERYPFVAIAQRSAEHTSELQSLMRISYAVLRLK